ncbi:MAG: hypothetical protein R2836_09835 [Chitinophagales bacterium]
MKIKKIFIWIPVLFGILIVNSCKDDDDNNVKTEICNNGLDDDGSGQTIAMMLTVQMTMVV